MATLVTVKEIPATTVKLTGPLPAPAVGVSVVETPLTVLGLTPILELVTETATVQPPGARLGTVRLSAVAPTTSAGLLDTPTQVPPIAADATVILVSVSVKLALVKIPVLALPKVKVTVLVPPAVMVEGPNAFVMVGTERGGAETIKSAEALRLELALVELTTPVVLRIPGDAATIELVT